MFIFRFIGRILSIGFILFLTYILAGTNAKGQSAWLGGAEASETIIGRSITLCGPSSRENVKLSPDIHLRGASLSKGEI